MRTKEGNKERDILEAAIKVFAENGYHNSKISKISEIAGVATGSVYVYFKNKETILLQIFEELWGKLYSEFDNISTTTSLSPAEKLDSMIDMVFDGFIENPSLAVVFVNEQNQLIRTNEIGFTNYYEKFLDQGEKVIREGIEKGVFSYDIDMQIFRSYIFGALRNLLHHWASDPKKYQLNKIRQNVKFLTKYGVMKKEG